MTDTQETLCSRCMHREVCKFKGTLATAYKMITSLKYTDGVKLQDYTFIGVRLDCEHFAKEKPSIKNPRDCTLEGREE